jgi:hypothetical protein
MLMPAVETRRVSATIPTPYYDVLRDIADALGGSLNETINFAVGRLVVEVRQSGMTPAEWAFELQKRTSQRITEFLTE